MSDRVFHHYESLEEFHAGMWKIVRGKERKNHVANAADLMKQPCEFKDAMARALDEWPTSCEANLTAESVNRIAWLGHAGCCIATGSPEECTRVAWHTLNADEQRMANKVADEVLTTWLRRRRVETKKPDLFDVVTS
jgi:hypothetical protein